MKSRSPKERDTANPLPGRPPLGSRMTRQQLLKSTRPPAWRMRSVSAGRLGLWSSVSLTARPALHSTARLSPQCAVYTTSPTQAAPVTQAATLQDCHHAYAASHAQADTRTASVWADQCWRLCFGFCTPGPLQYMHTAGLLHSRNALRPYPHAAGPGLCCHLVLPLVWSCAGSPCLRSGTQFVVQRLSFASQPVGLQQTQCSCAKPGCWPRQHAACRELCS